MSVVSSRSSSIASILKSSGHRAKLLSQQNRVNFQLPKNLKKILINYEAGCDRRVYDDLICTLRDAVIKDNELIELLSEVRQCISLFGPAHKFMVEALLNIKWTNRCPEATTAYKAFLEDLICVHIDHCKLAMDKLVSQFKPLSAEAGEWPKGKPREEDVQTLYHIHDVLFKFLQIVPMSNRLLLQALCSKFPYMKASTHTHEVYIHALLEIINYAPQFRSEILFLIINKLVTLDVHAPRSELESYGEEEENEDEEEDPGDCAGVFKIDQVDDDQNLQKSQKKHPIGHTLDVCMEKLLSFIYDTCHPQGILDMEITKTLYFDLLQIFEKAILPTYASHHIQFIMFYIASFKMGIVEAFLNWLWHKVSNPNVAPIIRQSSVAYIASLLARANFVPIPLLTRVIYDLSNWIHSYIAAQDSLECANSDVRVHTVFYSVCQAMFYIIGFRHKDLVDTKKNLLFLQSLNLTKIVTCRLNPLRVCLPPVVQHFATVTRAYQIAYCYTVIEHNSRSNLPVIQTSNRFTTWLDTFFPFDPYVLPESGHRIASLYMSYQGSVNLDNEEVSDKEENDEDDFMEVSFPQDGESKGHMEKFSYSTSPGFIHS